MKVELKKQDLISLTRGTTPYYDIMEHPLVKQCGTYFGGMRDEWHWNSTLLSELSETELWTLYKICKKSWK